MKARALRGAAPRLAFVVLFCLAGFPPLFKAVTPPPPSGFDAAPPAPPSAPAGRPLYREEFIDPEGPLQTAHCPALVEVGGGEE